jgi:nucleoside-diphosphate-sugar epimerase
VDDLADLYALMLRNAPAGTLLVGAAGTVTMRELGEVAAEIAGLPGTARSISVTEAQTALGPQAPVASFMTNLRVSGARAGEMLGWQPRRPTLREEARAGAYAHLTAHKPQPN